MTAKELSQLYHLNREIEQQQKRLDYLLGAKGDWRQHDCVQTSNGPGYTQKIEWIFSLPDSRMDNPFYDEIQELREDIRHNMARCIRERRRLEKYIGDVDDSEMRQLLALRFINGLPWAQIVLELGLDGDGSTQRKKVDRFLQTQAQ